MKIDRETAENLSWEKRNLPKRVTLNDPDETYTVHSSELGEEHRWYWERIIVFSKEGLDGYYQVTVDEEKTELQEGMDHPDEYECVEVEPYEVTLTRWRTKR